MKYSPHKTVEQYLNQYSHAADLGDWKVDTNWRHVLIIPVCGEDKDFLSQVLRHHTDTSVLVVLIVNRPSGHAKSAQWHEENASLIKALRRHARDHVQLNEQHEFFYDKRGVAVLLLNFNEHAFALQKGVGLARKIAADTALTLIHKGVVTEPWVFSTDADVILPKAYFAAVESVGDVVALSLDFSHVSDDERLLNIQACYDFKLRYYQQAVRFLGAAYDYIPLGSTLVLGAIAYAQVRGFPAKSGGEDFYLLNKLAKIGVVKQPLEPVVQIQIRFSDRVPFGTGPAVSQILQLHEANQALKYYHPTVFHVLKKWRQQLITYFVDEKLPTDDHGLNGYWQLEKILIKNKQQIKTTKRWVQFIHEWLDAFKILKSVHFLSTEFNPIDKQLLITLPAFKKLSAC